MFDNMIGKTFKNYKLVKPVGKGQFAIVFQGIDVRDNTPVAIKIILINYNPNQYHFLK